MASEKWVGIAQVESTTGIARATLRIWEHRYGFPAPARSGNGERVYPPEQIEKLRLVQALLAEGFRPSKVVLLSTEELQALLRTELAARPAPPVTDDPMLQLLRAHDANGLRNMLSHIVLSSGLGYFVTEKVARWNVLVGEAWARGEIQIFHEHFYVECVVDILRNAILDLPMPAAGVQPRVLLATLPGESHGLGMLMAQAMFALERCHCISLGLQVPINQIVAAAQAYESDVVGVSFTSSSPPGQVIRGLQELRRKLPSHVAIWAGGTCPAVSWRRVEGVTAFNDIGQIRPAILQYRADLPVA